MIGIVLYKSNIEIGEYQLTQVISFKKPRQQYQLGTMEVAMFNHITKYSHKKGCMYGLFKDKHAIPIEVMKFRWNWLVTRRKYD